MNVDFCPQCNLPLTATEAAATACPVCAASLSRPEATPSPALKPATSSAGGSSGPHGVYAILLVALMIAVVVLGFLLINQPRKDGNTDASVAPHASKLKALEDEHAKTLAEKETLTAKLAAAEKALADKATSKKTPEDKTPKEEKKATDKPAPAPELEAKLAAAEKTAREAALAKTALETKLATAEKATAAALEKLKKLEQEVAADKERLQKLEREKKDYLARLDLFKGFKELIPVLDPAKRLDPKLKLGPDGTLRVIHIDRPDGEFLLPLLNNKASVKLVGRVRKLRLEAIDNASLDASELLANEIVMTGGINNKATVQLNAPKGSITIPSIDGRSQAELVSREGKVHIGSVNGAAQVTVRARQFHLRDFLDGTETTITATLEAPGKLQFRELRGRTRLLWKKAAAADRDVEVVPGTVRKPAELKQMPAAG